MEKKTNSLRKLPGKKKPPTLTLNSESVNTVEGTAAPSANEELPDADKRAEDSQLPENDASQ